MGSIFVRGTRVHLREVTDDDLALIEPWYPEAASAVHGGAVEPPARDLQRRLEEARASGGALCAIVPAGEDAPAGLLDYRRGYPAGGWLTVGFVAMAARRRGWGYGSEAVRLLEGEALKRRWARNFRADVCYRNGLGLYFWLRLGYRPVAENTDAANTLALVRNSA